MMRRMTSRERIRAAFEHRETDRVPLDFGGHRSSGIAASLYPALKQALGIRSGDTYVYDIVQQLAIVEEPVLDALGVDTVELGRAFLTDDRCWKDWTLPDGTPCKIPGFINLERRGESTFIVSPKGTELAVLAPGSRFFKQIYHPYADSDFQKNSYADLEQVFPETMWTGAPSVGTHIDYTTPEGFQELREGARHLRALTERAIIGIFGGNMFEIPQFLYGIDKYLLYMGLYPAACERLSEVLYQRYAQRLETWLDAIGEYIDIALFADDLGAQTGPFMSPQMYRQYYKPWHARQWKRAKQKAGVWTMLHACGGYEPLLEDLIDAGLDSSNPVQINSRGMEPEQLKDRYGERFTFWGGGCDTGVVLPQHSPRQVRDHVRKLVDVWRRGGGFVFQQVHNIMPEVPVQNVLAMFEAVRTA
jgi:uroporphyrinogen decarboxylase